MTNFPILHIYSQPCYHVNVYSLADWYRKRDEPEKV